MPNTFLLVAHINDCEQGRCYARSYIYLAYLGRLVRKPTVISYRQHPIYSLQQTAVDPQRCRRLVPNADYVTETAFSKS